VRAFLGGRGLLIRRPDVFSRIVSRLLERRRTKNLKVARGKEEATTRECTAIILRRFELVNPVLLVTLLLKVYFFHET